MTDVAIAFAIAVGVINLAAAAFGASCWTRATPQPAFWILLRIGQAAAIAQALAAGALAATGFDPADGLYWLYALLPIPVAFVAEQLRAVSAQAVLDNRGLESAAAVGELGEAGQRSVVEAILLRELAVMATSAVVVAFLAWRAWLTAGG